MTKSKRTDGRGHWKKGTPRSTLTLPEQRDVRDKLREASKGYPVRALAEHLDLSPRAVDQILKGNNRPTRKTYNRIQSRGLPAPLRQYMVSLRDPLARWLLHIGNNDLSAGIGVAAARAGYR